MNLLGRLIVRKDKIAGLYIPFVPNGLESGIYNVEEILGEITIKRIGTPAMESVLYDSLDLNELYAKRGGAGMTEGEIIDLAGQKHGKT